MLANVHKCITFVHMNKQIRAYYDYIDEYNTHQQEAERPALPRLSRNQQSNVMGNESPTNHQTKKTILQMNKKELTRACMHWIVYFMLINSFLVLLALVWQGIADWNTYELAENSTAVGWLELLIACIAALAAYEEILLEREGIK